MRAHPVLQQGISPRFGSNTAGGTRIHSSSAAGLAAATLRAAVRPRPAESMHWCRPAPPGTGAAYGTYAIVCW